jgi:hypothetical protein
MICNNYSQVYKYYVFVAEFFKDKSIKILKTDAHNESKIWDLSIPLAPILASGNDLTCVEIDPEVLKLAKKNFSDIRMIEGDIRKLNQNENYDLILDFSTIDHLKPNEYEDVLKVYSKISKNISIIVWLSDTRLNEEKQFYFNNLNFRKKFREVFGDFIEILLFADYGASLVHFLALNDKNAENLILKGALELIEINKKQVTQAKEQEIVNLTQVIQAKEQEIVNLTQVTQAKEQEINNILNSTCWKITFPIRIISDFFRKLKK